MQVSDLEDPGLRWTDEFGICSTIEGKVHEIKDFGGVVKFEQYNDVYGFISRYQSKELCEIHYGPALFALGV